MPSWKKLIVSGSDANLNSLIVNNAVTASFFDGVLVGSGSGSFSGSFQGDGSQLSGITADVVEITTVTASFTNTTSSIVNHNFDTKNVIISVYDNSDNQVIPQSVVLTDNNNVTITFSSPESGFVVVAKGGHVVSGSVANILPAIVNSSTNRILTDNGDGTLTAEANLTFDGSILAVNTNNLYVSGGRIGIGTTSPTRNLDLESSTGTSVGIQLNSTGTGGRSYSFFSTNNGSSLGGGKFGFYDDTAQASRFTVDSLGNVGIGTTSPSQLLTVAGNISGSGNLDIDGNTTLDGTLTVKTNELYVSGSRIGIGTNNPAVRLDIQQNSTYNLEANSGIRIFTDTSTTGILLGADPAISASYIQALDPGTSFTTRPLLLMPNGGVVGIGTIIPSTARLTVAGNISGSGNLKIAGDLDINGNSFFVNSSTNRVGIATNTPASVLDISVTDSTVWSSLWTNVSNDAFTPKAHELTIQNGQDATDGSFAGIFFKAGETALNSQINAARIAAVREAAFDTALVFSNRSVAAGGMAENMRITAAGNMGIGTTIPSQKLTISGSISGSGNLDIDGNATVDGDLTVAGKITAQEFHTEFVSASIIYESGSTKFGDTLDDIHQFTGSVAITGSLNVDGTATVTSLVETSKRELKDNIVLLSSQLDTIQKLNPVSFNFKGQEKTHFGFIVDEVEKIYPEFISDDEAGINYSKMVSVLTKAIQELSQKVSEQQIFIDKLTERIFNLEQE
jgi:cytoskeletal protein CcmA (bactofilin family)